MPIRITSKGSFDNSRNFLKKLQDQKYLKVLDAAGRAGVASLQAATPKDSGRTADFWSYEIEKNRNGYSIHWTNDNFGEGTFSIAVGLQYGHATGTGGWVSGEDYINPAMRPIFEVVANDVWNEVESA